jgi:hypothetical protein
MAVQATYFREQADNSRDLASRLDDREMQQHLLEIAEQYDRLAREAAAPLMRVASGQPAQWMPRVDSNHD